MKHKGIANIAVIIAVVILAAFTGYFIYLKRQPPSQPSSTNPPATTQTKTTPPANQNSSLSDIALSEVLNSNGFKNGERNTKLGNDRSFETIIQKHIAFGDIDGDGTKEVVAPIEWCGASCGTQIYVFKKTDEKIISAVIPGEETAGAFGKVYDGITIQNAVIVVKWHQKENNSPTGSASYRVKFINNDLFVLAETRNDVGTWKVYRNDQYGFEVKYPPEFRPSVIDQYGRIRFETPGIDYFTLYVLPKEKPKISHFLSNPECYQKIDSENYNSVPWTISFFICGYSWDKHVAASTLNSNINLVFEIHLSSGKNSSLNAISTILATFRFIR